MKNSIGQRQLAAIVFTDVAGFSSKVATDEENTLRRVQEDLELLKTLSSGRNGKIVKTTGDGLLISFGSAVDAVSFAIEAQKKLSARNETLSPGDRLEHRMGIHLGDIFLTENEAMGDGVNIAARLQSEAEPGGICVSQTVYNVVKNKLAIKAVSIGPRELKNIREAIYAYRIVVDAESSLAKEAASEERARTPRRRIIIYSAIAAAVVIGLIAAFMIGFGERGAGTLTGPDSTQSLEEAEPPLLPREVRADAIKHVAPRLARHGRGDPLTVRIFRRRPPGSRPVRPKVMKVWMEGDEVVLAHDGRVRRRRLEQLEPRIFSAIAAELAREDRRREAGIPDE